MLISDWSSDVCSSDLLRLRLRVEFSLPQAIAINIGVFRGIAGVRPFNGSHGSLAAFVGGRGRLAGSDGTCHGRRSEEHTSELQSLMRISYAVFCLKKKNRVTNTIPV